MTEIQDVEKFSREKYRLIAENISDLIEIINESFIIEYINESAHIKLLGYNREDLTEKSIENFIYLVDFGSFLKNFEKAMEIGETTVEIRMRHRKGYQVWFEAKIRAFLDTDDEKKVLIISRDITERKNVERFISDITEHRKTEKIMKNEINRIREFDKIRKDLISGISHELKTPLMSINGSCELLLEIYSDQLGKDASELISLMARGGKRLEGLIEKLLDITRIEFNKLRLEKNEENLCDVVKQCSKEIFYHLKQRKIQLHHDLPKNLKIRIDKIRIEQVITNMLLNAIKNTPPEGKINITLRKSEDMAIMTIKDTGIGFTKDEMQQLFTKFGKIERYGEGFEYIDIQGSGLGLFITKEIVEMHNGKIWAESEGRHKGAIFIVELPLK